MNRRHFHCNVAEAKRKPKSTLKSGFFADEKDTVSRKQKPTPGIREALRASRETVLLLVSYVLAALATRCMPMPVKRQCFMPLSCSPDLPLNVHATEHFVSFLLELNVRCATVP